MEQMQYKLLFRWFVGLGIDDPVLVPTVFTKNRDRLLTTKMSPKVGSSDPLKVFFRSFRAPDLSEAPSDHLLEETSDETACIHLDSCRDRSRACRRTSDR